MGFEVLMAAAVFMFLLYYFLLFVILWLFECVFKMLSGALSAYA